MSIVLCPAGHENPLSRKFCGECGGALPETEACCPSGHRNPPAQKYCGECGVRIHTNHGGAAATGEEAFTSLNEMLSVEMVAKDWLPRMPELDVHNSRLKLTFAFDNRTDKDIRAFFGQVVFLDLFDRERKRITLTSDLTAVPGRTCIESADWYIDLNEYLEADQWLVSHELANMHVVVVVEAILFADGTQVGGIGLSP